MMSTPEYEKPLPDPPPADPAYEAYGQFVSEYWKHCLAAHWTQATFMELWSNRRGDPWSGAHD